MNDAQTQSMHKKLARNVSLLTVSVAITMALSLILKMLLPRIMGPEKMGIFYFSESIAGIFFTFLPLGLTTYINRTVPSNHDHPRSIMSTILVTEIVVAMILGLSLLGFVHFSNKSDEIILCVLFMGAYSAFFIFKRSILQTLFLATDQVKLISLVNIGVKILLVSGCLAMLLLKPSVVGVAIMFGLSELAGVTFLLFIAYKQSFLSTRPSFMTLKSILKISLPFYLSTVLISIYGEVDTFMLGQLTSDIEVGYFGAAYKLIGVGMLMIPIINSSFTPSLSQALHQDTKRFETLVKQLLQVLLVFCLPLIVALTLFGDHLARTLYGSGFEASYKIVCFLTPVLIMMYLNTFTAIGLNLSSSGSKISRIFVFGLVLNVVLDYLIIPWGLTFGPGGAGTAVGLTTFICELYTFLAMLRIYPVKILDLRLVKNIMVILSPCWLAMLFYDDMIALSLWQRIGIASLTPLYAIVTRLVTKAEIQFFFGFLQSVINSRK